MDIDDLSDEEPNAGDGPFTLTVESEIFTVKARSEPTATND